MGRLLAVGALAATLLLSIDAAACQSDRDCPAASRCVRAYGEPYGVCARGVAPVEGDERRRTGDPSEPKIREGMPCEFSSDCAPGLACVGQGSPDQRVCSR